MTTEGAFQKNFDDGNEIGAAISIWKNGTEVTSLQGGFTTRNGSLPWDSNTLVPIWSATKGPASATLLLALESADLSLDSPVSSIWPELAQNGKEKITFAQLLSHQAGLAALDEPPQITDYEAVIAALESQPPNWKAGHGYHPRTFGFLLDECVRRITGTESLGAYWHKKIAEPHQIDLWIGLPETEFNRVATIYPGRMAKDAKPDAFYRQFADPTSLTKRAFGSPTGLNAVSDMNQQKAWTEGFPAMGGIASASGLAKFYDLLGSGKILKSLDSVTTTQASGPDQILIHDTCFSAGFMKDPVDQNGIKMRTGFGPSLLAFGHPGAGGSLGLHDPESGISYAYVMNQMELSVLPTEKALAPMLTFFP